MLAIILLLLLKGGSGKKEEIPAKQQTSQVAKKEPEVSKPSESPVESKQEAPAKADTPVESKQEAPAKADSPVEPKQEAPAKAGSPVELKQEAPAKTDSPVEPKQEVPAKAEKPAKPAVVVKIIEEEKASIEFAKNSTKFIDDREAEKWMSIKAKEILAEKEKHPELTIRVIGYVADFPNGIDDTELSLSRANVVIKGLIKNGVPANILTAVPMGATSKWGNNLSSNRAVSVESDQ